MPTQVLITSPGWRSLIVYSVCSVVHTSQDQFVTELLWKEAFCSQGTISAFEVKNQCRRFSSWCPVPVQEEPQELSEPSPSYSAAFIKGSFKKRCRIHMTRTAPVSELLGLSTLKTLQWRLAGGRMHTWFCILLQRRAKLWAFVYIISEDIKVRAEETCLLHIINQRLLFRFRVGPLWSFDRPLIPLRLPGLGTSAQPGNSREGILGKSLPPVSWPASSSRSPHRHRRGRTPQDTQMVWDIQQFTHLWHVLVRLSWRHTSRRPIK